MYARNGTRKIHTGLPALIVRTLSEIVLTDMNDFEFVDEQQRQIWEEIADPKNNNFSKKIKRALKDVLTVGTARSRFPLIQR